MEESERRCSMKKLIAFLAIVVLLMTMFSVKPVVKAGSLKTVVVFIGATVAYVDEKITTLDQAPVIINGRTMVPVRFVSESLGATVDWNQSTKEVTIKLSNNTVVLKIDSTTAIVNGSKVSLDVPATIAKKTGRTLVPLRFVSEAFGAIVTWDETKKSVKIEYSPDWATTTWHVMLYSSMKEDQLAALQKAFTKKYPKVKMDYYTAGTGKVMTKLAAEIQAGKIGADIIWVGEPTNYLSLKAQGVLLPYVSPEARTMPKQFIDKDNTYCAARLVAMVLVYNTNAVKGADIPKDWEDLLNPKFKDRIVITDPAMSGTSLYTVGGLVQNPKYGWTFIEKLKANGMRLESGSTSTVEKVGTGDYDIGIGADYIAENLKEKGSPIDFVYPKSGISVIASPVAIIKTSANIEAAKLLYNYILSVEGQTVLASAGVVPVRAEVKPKFGLSGEEIMKRALPIDDEKLEQGKDDLLKKFADIMKK